jgi:hypothetical protein
MLAMTIIIDLKNVSDIMKFTSASINGIPARNKISQSRSPNILIFAILFMMKPP